MYMYVHKEPDCSKYCVLHSFQHSVLFEIDHCMYIVTTPLISANVKWALSFWLGVSEHSCHSLRCQEMVCVKSVSSYFLKCCTDYLYKAVHLKISLNACDVTTSSTRMSHLGRCQPLSRNPMLQILVMLSHCSAGPWLHDWLCNHQWWAIVN